MLHWEVKHSFYTREDADKALKHLHQRAETGNYREKWYLGRIYHAGIKQLISTFNARTRSTNGPGKDFLLA